MSRTRPSTPAVSLGTLLQSLVLVRVRLSRLVVNTARVDELEQAEDGSLGIHTKAGLIRFDDGEAVFELGVRVWAPRAMPPVEAPLLILSERTLTYAGVPEGTPRDVLDEFCRTSVPLAGWPYLRRDVHEACLEADIPPVLLPLVKAPAVGPRDEVVAGKPTVAWAAYRAPLLEAFEQIEFLFDHEHVASLSRPLGGELTDQRWGLAVAALSLAFRSVMRRLKSNLRDDEVQPFLSEVLELATELEQFVTHRKSALAGQHPESLTRWNEFAASLEGVLRGAWKAGIIASKKGPKLRRLSG